MELTELGKTPIPGASPTGDEARSDDAFEKLQAEIDKLSTPSGDGIVDWEKVITLSTAILQTKSKDLLVACYLCAGLFETRQVEGLLPGLTVLRDMVETWWDDLFPAKRRMRGRRNAVQWWIDRLSDRIDAKEWPPVPKETYDAILSAGRGFDAALSGADSEAPLLRPVIGRLERLAFIEPASEPAPNFEPEPTAAQGEAPSAPPVAAPPSSAASAPPPASSTPSAPRPVPAAPKYAPGADPMQAARDGIDTVRQAALAMLETNIADPAAWRASRLAHWFAVVGLPPAVNGVTRIPPPPAQVKGPLAALSAAANGAGLARSAEGLFHQYLYWLDLPRIVADALQSLGPSHADAYKTVCDMTAAFVATHDGVQRLSFADQTPFADAATLDWLDGIALTKGGGSASSGGDDNEGVEAALAAAGAKIAGGDFAGGVEAVQRIIATARSQRGRLMARIGLCELLVRSKKAKLATPHLGQALGDIGHYDLERYDPDLALRGLKAAYRGYRETQDAELAHKAEELLDRIAMLDPAGAVRLFEATPT
ncbi:MAG: type VI secretion system protein TssA [Nitrospinae bacterium]|nr:type VI secretion system protein TssA [Nitrospinota bacterium]